MTSFKTASLHLVIPCRNDLKEKVQNQSCIRVLVAIRFLADYRLLPFSRTDTFGHFWTPWALGALHKFPPSYMSPSLLRLWANESNGAILCSGKAGWARRPGSVQEVSFLRLGLSIHSKWKRSIAYYIRLCYPPESNIERESTCIWYPWCPNSAWVASGSLCWISDMGVVHWLDESAPKIAKWDTCRGACAVCHVVGPRHPCKPRRCCLTAALYVLFELEFCCIIVVFGLPASLFPWQF